MTSTLRIKNFAILIICVVIMACILACCTAPMHPVPAFG